MRLRGLSSYNVIAAWRKRLSFVAGKFHFDGLRVIAEIFPEQIKPAFVACVVLDSDRQLNGRALQKIQIVERNARVKELIVEENALFIHDDVFQNSELRGGYRPEFGSVFAASAAAASSLKCNIREKYSGETSLTGMAGLTYFGVCDKTDEIVAYLEKHDYAMHCGMLGAKYLLGALGKSEKTDELLRLLTKTDYPSFGFWYASGMTTLSENFEMSASLNHHMYSYIVENAIRYFVGVMLGKDRKSAIVEPSLPAGLNRAEYTFATEGGLFRAVASRAENGNKTLRLTVPSGFSAEAFGKMYEKGEYVIGF